MTDGEALHRAILANPAEDEPRLQYADWLQENGEPERAEFIKLQVDSSRFPPRPEPHHERCKTHAPYVGCATCDWDVVWKPRHVRSRGLQAEILQHHCERWLLNLVFHLESAWGRQVNCKCSFSSVTLVQNVPQEDPPALSVTLRLDRGFVSRVDAPSALFDAGSEFPKVLFSDWPIQTVNFPDLAPSQTAQRRGGRTRRWTWFARTAFQDVRPFWRNVLPPHLMPEAGKRRCNYKTESQALYALSDRAVHYGRVKAGLAHEVQA